MKIYDDAHKLAKQIRESKEYKEYRIKSSKKSTSRRIWTFEI